MRGAWLIAPLLIAPLLIAPLLVVAHGAGAQPVGLDAAVPVTRRFFIVPTFRTYMTWRRAVAPDGFAPPGERTGPGRIALRAGVGGRVRF